MATDQILIPGSAKWHTAVLRNSEGRVVWTCDHKHATPNEARECVAREVERRYREATRRTRIRLPGIHADIVLEKMPSHPNGDGGVDMTICPSKEQQSAEVELTIAGVRQLIDALAEIAGL